MKYYVNAGTSSDPQWEEVQVTDRVEAISGPRTTTRAVYDFSRHCSLRCKFCYYLPTDDFHGWWTWAEIEAAMLEHKAKGSTCADWTGGEPMQHPDIARGVRFSTELGIPVRVITSLICAEKTLDDVLDAGIDDWLISMHGFKDETHNEIVAVPKARYFQIRRLRKISRLMRYCCNYVMIRQNQTEIADWAAWIANQCDGEVWRSPRIVNFIMHNPHYGWRKNPETMNLSCDLRIAGPQIDEAIDTLESLGIGVNVRYTPYCALRQDHWKNVCNDLHVAFDSGEWNNAIKDRSTAGAYDYGKRLSLGNEEKGAPCNECALQWVCGGANKVWHEANTAVYGEQLRPVDVVRLDYPTGHDNFYAFRQLNALGMA